MPEDMLSLSDLLADGVIEYIDVNEENNCLIALQESELTEGKYIWVLDVVSCVLSI